MADIRDEEEQVVPLPASETEEERRKIRASNDRDQQLEREGKAGGHNRGYDEAADGVPAPQVAHVVDE